MSSDQIQPERDVLRPRSATPRADAPDQIFGRAWVKRDLEFWQRCTVERWRDAGVTVSLDSMEEFTVDPADVAQLELEPGDVVFLQHWDGCISGTPVIVVRTKGETAEVAGPAELFGKADNLMCLLRDLRFYRDVKVEPFKKGARVFAYKTKHFTPELFLLFPATVEAIHLDICYEVEFGDGEPAYVPATLVEKRDLQAGDVVHTCTHYQSNRVTYEESWGPCRIVQREGDNLLLRDGTGEQFEADISLIAVLPRGYRMLNGKLERITAPLAESIRPTDSVAWVHIVRTDHWLDAADDPITKEQVETLLAADPELSWSMTDWAEWVDEEGMAARHFALVWRGNPCIWWYRNEIKCAAPDAELLAKLIAIAIALDANVIGDDGHEYH